VDIEISIVQPCAQEVQDTVLSRQAISCSLATIDQVIESLAKDQLGLHKYSRLVGGIGVKRDGSGGAVTWATNHRHPGYGGDCDYDVQRKKLSACKDHRADFVAEQDGRQFRMLQSDPHSLLGLPKSIRDDIFRKASRST
jgi:hypothetical protein